MTTEVTQKMWVEVMGSNPREYKGDNFPVTASWEGAQSFIRKLNRLDPGKGYRLPAEAEWEYACRAGTTTRYYWGDDPKNSAIGNNCWTYVSETHEVGLKAPNDWGLYDMSGSVWEWCEDYYHKNYNGAPMDGSAWISPEETYRVLRGGSYHTLWSDCRSARRYYDYPSSGNKNCIGFRLVRNY
jgi:formylglycine-generating enzyme required for sulfatase activity